LPRMLFTTADITNASDDELLSTRTRDRAEIETRKRVEDPSHATGRNMSVSCPLDPLGSPSEERRSIIEESGEDLGENLVKSVDNLAVKGFNIGL